MKSKKEGNPMKVMRTLVFLFLIFSIASGCNKPQTKALVQAVPSVPKAWIDAPLDSSILPLEPYEVVFHIANLGGVAQGELSVNGVVLAALPNPGGSESPATLRQVWTPAQPGVYTLKERCQASSGEWSDYIQSVVTIKDSTITPPLTFTPTVTPSLSVTPTLTFTPTFTVTPSQTPTKTTTPTPVKPAVLTFTRQVSANQFFYGGCDPAQVNVQVQVSDPVNVYSVVLFQRIEGKAWDGGTAMSPQGGGQFSLTVTGNKVPAHDGVTSSTWQHQFVATDRSGNVIGRSGTYTDVVLSSCAAPRHVPQIKVITITPTPTATFIFVK
jgi:hypothetical protein